jgi:hypothetical protein
MNILTRSEIIQLLLYRAKNEEEWKQLQQQIISFCDKEPQHTQRYNRRERTRLKSKSHQAISAPGQNNNKIENVSSF